jgi:hypothetical protein
LYYCTRCLLDKTGEMWDTHRSLWGEIRALYLLLLDYPSLSRSETMAMRECLTFGTLQIARDCTSSAIRSCAIELCRAALVPELQFDVRAFVIGTYVTISAEGAARGDGEGLVPPTVKYDWTSAVWNEEHTELHVTLTLRLLRDDLADQRHFTIRQESWDTILVE